ncbi:hypothetical protein BGZ72_004080 [Mortierella alpina]|nr:hypothetical protein BGZ72_004080 [Mortierella alpina]
MHSVSVNSPSALAPLPPECLELILDCLRNDLASLRQLLLVSRQLFQLTVPVLYRSPFRLAAGIPDPPPLSSASHSDAHSHSQPHAYDSTTGWAKFLDRTKLLSRLLIQNLQIKPLGKVPRLTVHKASLLDDSSGMESLEPLLPTSEQLNLPKRSVPVKAPNDWSQSCATESLDNEIYNNADSADPSSVTSRELAQDDFNHCPDLIRFDDEWRAENFEWSASGQHMPGQQRTAASGAASCSADQQEDYQCHTTTTTTRATTTNTGTGLLMDYFHFYSHVDHRSIASVIRHIYPGAGRRECDRFMAEIERAVLMHNPRQIVSIHVQCPSVVIPHLLANMDQFQQISAIELLDAVWTIRELEMVYQFLSEHAAMFPAGDIEAEERAASGQHAEVATRPLLALRQGIRRRTAAIRRFKYATIRNHWDDTLLGHQRFDPLQLIKALGPGLEVIESVHWPRTTLQDLDSLDVSSLHTLRIGFLDPPREGTVFSQPAFLRRCRQLRTLAGFSSARDMFSWAVEDWNASKRKRNEVTIQQSSATAASLQSAAESWRLSVRPLVELQHLRVHGPTDQVVFDILRDAFYGFRNSLRVLEARSDLEHLEGEAEWMDKSMDLLSGRPHSSHSHRAESCAKDKGQPLKTGQESRARSRREGDEEEEEGDVDDKACYDRLSSISSGSLLIQWRLPQLTVLQLTGPIAAVFDLDSLLQMPSLHTVCFSILIAPSPWVRRTPSSFAAAATTTDMSGGHQQRGSSVGGRSNMSQLPLLTGPALRRVLIKGPWREITDKSLQQMIAVRIQGPKRNDGDDSNSQQEERCWGDQLVELSVLDNSRVTVPGMVQLARQMDGLQVMGMSLNMPAVSETFSGHYYPHHHHHPTRDSESSMSRCGAQEDSETIARNMVMKARLELPWVDLGPDANHLARRVRRDGYLSRGWDV